MLHWNNWSCGLKMTLVLMHQWLSSTLAHPPEFSFFHSLCLFEFLIILIFSERLILAYWNALLLWPVESCLEWGAIVYGRNQKLLLDASGCQQLWQWIIVLTNVILHSIWNILSLWKVRVDLLVRLFEIYCLNAWNGQLSSVFCLLYKHHYRLLKNR